MTDYTPEFIEQVQNNPSPYLDKTLAEIISSISDEQGQKILEKLDANKKTKVSLMVEALRSKQKEKTLWESALKQNTYEAFTNFIKLYPDSEFVNVAKEKVKEINEKNLQADLAVAKSDSASMQTMKEFIEKYKDSANPDDLKVIEDKIAKKELEYRQNDELAYSQIVSQMYNINSDNLVLLICDYIRNYTNHLSEADDLLWTKVSLMRTKESVEKYINAFDGLNFNPKHLDAAVQLSNDISREEAQRKAAEAMEPIIMSEIHSVLMNPYSDVPDYLRLCRTYPQKKDYIKTWMINDMKLTPGRYQRDEMYTLMFHDEDMGTPLFNPLEITSNGILTQQRVDWIRTHRLKEFDDTEDVTPQETCFETEKNNTDVFFFGVPGSGKTSVLAGLLSATRIDNDYSFKFLSKGCMHKGYNYATNLQKAVNNHVFPARTRVSNYSASISGRTGQKPVAGTPDAFAGMMPSLENPQFGAQYNPTAPMPENTDRDLFIQIIDAKIEGRDSEHKISIVEMPGERTLRFAAAQSNDMSMLGAGTKKLFTNDNHKVFFFVIDPNDKKLNEVEMNGATVSISQAATLTAVADFLVDLLKRGELKKLDSVHIIMAKSDLIDNTGTDMRTAIEKIMKQSDYAQLVDSLKKLCDKKYGNVNAHCNHMPHLFTFSLGRILPGDMFDYDPEDSKKILKVIRSNTISVGDPTVWDTICKYANQKVF